MPDDDNRALEQLRAQLFGPAPATHATAPPPAAVAHHEGTNPTAALDADQVFRDWALRVIDANQYRALNPTPLADMGRD